MTAKRSTAPVQSTHMSPYVRVYSYSYKCAMCIRIYILYIGRHFNPARPPPAGRPWRCELGANSGDAKFMYRLFITSTSPAKTARKESPYMYRCVYMCIYIYIRAQSRRATHGCTPMMNPPYPPSPGTRPSLPFELPPPCSM